MCVARGRRTEEGRGVKRRQELRKRTGRGGKKRKGRDGKKEEQKEAKGREDKDKPRFKEGQANLNPSKPPFYSHKLVDSSKMVWIDAHILTRVTLNPALSPVDIIHHHGCECCLALKEPE